MITGIELIQAERRRQVEVEGWTAEHDAGHCFGELSLAGRCYLWAAQNGKLEVPPTWPFTDAWWKPTSKKRMLEKAGALFLAEAEKIDRQPKACGVDAFEVQQWKVYLAERVDECARELDVIIPDLIQCENCEQYVEEAITTPDDVWLCKSCQEALKEDAAEHPAPAGPSADGEGGAA